MLERVLLGDLSFEIKVTFDVTDQAIASRIRLLLELDSPTAETISGFPRVIQNKEATKPQPQPVRGPNLASYRSFANAPESASSMPSFSYSPAPWHSIPASPMSSTVSDTIGNIPSTSPTHSGFITNQRLLADGYLPSSYSLPMQEPTIPAAHGGPSLASLPTGYHSQLSKGPSGPSKFLSSPGMSSSIGPSMQGGSSGPESTTGPSASKLRQFSKMLSEYSGGLRKKPSPS